MNKTKRSKICKRSWTVKPRTMLRVKHLWKKLKRNLKKPKKLSQRKQQRLLKNNHLRAKIGVVLQDVSKLGLKAKLRTSSLVFRVPTTGTAETKWMHIPVAAPQGAIPLRLFSQLKQQRTCISTSSTICNLTACAFAVKTWRQDLTICKNQRVHSLNWFNKPKRIRFLRLKR